MGIKQIYKLQLLKTIHGTLVDGKSKENKCDPSTKDKYIFLKHKKYLSHRCQTNNLI